MQIIRTRGLTFLSLLKLLFTGLLIPLFLLGLAAGIASYLGSSTVSLNGEYVYGVKGLITGMILGVVLPAILSLIVSILVWIGSFLWGRLHVLTLHIKD